MAKETEEKIENSLTGLFSNLRLADGAQSQLSQTTTQYLNLRYYLISNERTLLSHMYTEHGLVQTLVGQPVDDAFRGGVDISSSQLDTDDIKKINTYMERNRTYETIKQSLKWARLFGGGAIVVMTDQKADTPLDIGQLKEKTDLEFRAVDMWELYAPELVAQGAPVQVDVEFYHYYGVRVHHSRVFRVQGKEAPSFIRKRLRGWGMSELEKLVRSINQYMKNQDVVFELMDEAKVDVYKIDGFNSSLSTTGGTESITKRMQIANQLKNFQNAIVMDVKDEYDQKDMKFAGLGDMLKQIREGIAADLKMPVSKLFGISSTGFSSGEDDIENYNAMIEAEIRSRIKYIVIDIISLVCQKVLGFVPDDLEIEFPELRMMSTEQVELAKTNEFNRVISSFQSGLIDGLETKEAINASKLLPIEIEENDDIEEPIAQKQQGDFIVSDDKVE